MTNLPVRNKTFQEKTSLQGNRLPRKFFPELVKISQVSLQFIYIQDSPKSRKRFIDVGGFFQAIAFCPRGLLSAQIKSKISNAGTYLVYSSKMQSWQCVSILGSVNWPKWIYRKKFRIEPLWSRKINQVQATESDVGKCIVFPLHKLQTMRNI